MNYTQAVSLALEGKDAGFEYLYESTYQSKYYLALKYMKNEDAAQDVLQDAYVKAFDKLNTLDNPEAFPGWLGMIVANTAKNALQKNNPVLFSDLAAAEDTQPVELEIEDENPNYQPENAYSRKETQLLVRELIDSLSEEQRICILMFELENVPIKDIAAALQCSENTVKSRLNYGRKNIKKKAEELQKKGYKLYSVAPLSLLLWLLQQEKASLSSQGVLAAAQVSAADTILPRSAGNTAASGTAGSTGAAGATTASETAKATAGVSKAAAGAAKSGAVHSAAVKITAMVLSATLAGSFIGYGAGTIQNHAEEKRMMAEATVSQPSDQSSAEMPTAEPTEPPVRTMRDEDYPNLIAGHLTKEELQYVLAYGPGKMDGDSFAPDPFFEYGMLGNRVSKDGEIISARDGIPVEYYGPSDDHQYQIYSVADLNRLLESFTSYRYTEENHPVRPGESYVQGDKLYSCMPQNNVYADAEIFSAEYTEDEMVICYHLHRISYIFSNPPYHYGGETKRDRRAILRPLEDGTYRIDRIEALPDPGYPTREAAYQSVLEELKHTDPRDLFTPDLECTGTVLYSYLDMDGDGTEELILGVRRMVNHAPEWEGLERIVYYCEETDEGFVPVRAEGRIQQEDLTFVAKDRIGILTANIYNTNGNMATVVYTLDADGTLRGRPDDSYQFNYYGQAYIDFLNSEPYLDWTLLE